MGKKVRVRKKTFRLPTPTVAELRLQEKSFSFSFFARQNLKIFCPCEFVTDACAGDVDHSDIAPSACTPVWSAVDACSKWAYEWN